MGNSEKSWQERFEEQKASGDLVPMGGGRYISREGFTKVMQQADEFMKKHPTSFMGEQEHPEVTATPVMTVVN